MEDPSQGEEPTLDVAPLISDAKAAQALRRFLSTVLGGGRILPGMTLKIYVFQVLLWFCPVLLSATLALGVDIAVEKWPYLRLVVGAALNLVFGASLELLHCALRAKARHTSAEPGVAKMAWLDDEDVDFHHLCSSEVMDILLPRRPPFAALWCCLISSALGGLTAQLLVPKHLAATLQLDPTSSLVVSCWVFLTAGASHFGLHVQATTEVSLSSTESRSFLVIALLLPLLLDLPVAVARGLLVSVALLPLLWAIGVLPSLLDLLLWSLEQVELHFFGGSGGSMLLSVLLSISVAAMVTWVGREKILMDDTSWDELLLGIISLSCTALLTSAVPYGCHVAADLACRCWCLLGCWLQVAVAAGLLVPCVLMLPSDVLIPLRLAMEQVALLLTLLAVYIFGVRQLSVSCCSLRNEQYLRRRKQLLWGDQGPRDAPPVSAQLMEVTSLTEGLGSPSLPATSSAWPLRRLPRPARRHVRQVEVLETMARIVLLVHMGLFATPSLVEYRGADKWWSFFVLVALQLRQMRVCLADVPKAALDAALAGLLHLGPWTFSTWPIAVQIWFVSVLRQRGVVFGALLRYVVHLSRITWAIPKLRHPLTSLLLWLNVLFWPGLLVVLVLCAILETPLIAVFSLPLFTLAPPRWSRVALSANSSPLVKGAEGLFYSILAPSLLHGLAQQWRAGILRRDVGTLLFCRSHERLACVVRILASGFGWVQVELRGLELQEPTSCHHVEAGQIDEVFAHAFESQRAPKRPSFVLEPICEIVVSTYEQSVVSLRGLLDNPEVLRQIHGLFLKSLVWVMMSLKEIPEGWLTCPLKPQDTKEVVQQLCSMAWPSEVAEVLHSSGSAAASASALRATASQATAAVAPANIPRPPGTPPIIRPPQKVNAAVPPTGLSPLATLEPELSEADADDAADAADTADVEDLDTLMDQVLGMAPVRGRVGPSQSRDAAPARQAARKLLATNEGDDAWATPASLGPVANAPSLRAAGPTAVATGALEEHERSWVMGESRPTLDSKELCQEFPIKELTPLARLVTEAYVAMNVAPLYGQKPETYGTSHVLRLFTGNIAQEETAELSWLVERPELFQLTCRAFRFAVKISIDAAAMGEEVDMEYRAFAELAEDLRRSWFLGVEGSLPWEVAMKQRWPNLMALKGRSGGIAEVQIVRLCYTEDACRVGELRRGVWSSTWASASLELRYFANDDDERYSIQAHPTLCRNMAVQCAEYPIFVSPATTVWLS